MDNQKANIQDSCDMSISSEEEDGFEHHKEGNVRKTNSTYMWASRAYPGRPQLL
jgi:hypothetical protein